MTSPAPAAPLVTLSLWGVPSRGVPLAFVRMGLHRRPLRAMQRDGALQFWKLLGTGDGRTFTVRDADPRHWGLLAVWDGVPPTAVTDPASHDAPPPWRAWRRSAEEELALVLRPVAARGEWAGQRPFGDPAPARTHGTVASLTRARIRPSRAATFWRAVPPVSADLRQVPGLRLAVGVGEAPVGLQGTFSLWDDDRALREFAHRRAPHVEAVRRTAEEGWYVEELFARFAVERAAGTFDGAAFDVRPDTEQEAA